MNAQGTTVLVAENVEPAFDIADRACGPDQARWSAASERLADNEIKERYCSV